ncbi:MAG: hypothetical protein GYA21_13970 [Myxococcales bacterium]|nr:hypothetical protein [Myxococcales bacterium]
MRKTCLLSCFCFAAFLFSACGGESARCGNGKVEGTEQCDGANLAAQTCRSQGFNSGTLSCKQDCTFETAACSQQLPLPDFAMGFAEAACQNLLDCCDPTELAQIQNGQWTDLASCVNTYSGILSQYVITPMQSAVSAGRGQYDATKAGACLSAFRALECTGQNDLVAFFNTCEHFYVGLQGADAVCQSSLDCADYFVCVKAAGQSEGVCKHLLDKGATCEVNVQPACMPDYYCDATTQKCEDRKPENAACGGNECQAGLTCGDNDLCSKPAPVCDGK